MSYEGYLLKFGEQILPNKYIARDSYKATPNQRLELDAWRDANGLLHRDTIPNTKTKIEFETRDGMTLVQKAQMQSIIAAGIVSDIERKYRVTYWNDETNSYKTGEFYISDVQYPILDVWYHHQPRYRKTRFALIEY